MPVGIQELPLLAASSLMETAPMVGKSWQLSDVPPRVRREFSHIL